MFWVGQSCPWFFNVNTFQRFRDYYFKCTVCFYLMFWIKCDGDDLCTCTLYIVHCKLYRKYIVIPVFFRVCAKRRGVLIQSWAHVTTVATTNSRNFIFWLRGTNIFPILANHFSLNALSHCCVVAYPKVKKIALSCLNKWTELIYTLFYNTNSP